jgi:hypothetical protein
MSPFDSSMRLSEANSAGIAAHQPGLMDDFFKSIRMGCFPAAAEVNAKTQPWKGIWTGPKQASAGGKMLVACPKNCAYGSFTLFPLIGGS